MLTILWNFSSSPVGVLTCVTGNIHGAKKPFRGVKEENKLIFHVALMNKDYINIKVDREERLDDDKMYMNFVQAISGRGGWPMSVWMTPELKPIYGGTYYPPDDRYYGQPGFASILKSLADQLPVASDKDIGVRHLSLIFFRDHEFQQDENGWVHCYTDGSWESNMLARIFLKDEAIPGLSKFPLLLEVGADILKIGNEVDITNAAAHDSFPNGLLISKCSSFIVVYLITNRYWFPFILSYRW